MSASSIGPIGMPNASAASSTVSGRDAFVDAAHRRHQVRREHAVDEEARRALHRQRQLVDLADERRRRRGRAPRRVCRADDDLDQHHLRHRIEEVEADRAASDRASPSRCPRAESTTCWSRGSRLASRLRLDGGEQAALGVDVLEDRFDDRRRRAPTPSPATSGISRSVASRTRRGSRRRSAKSFAARPIAGASRSAFWSCSVTVRPRSAHHAAMSPPIVPAPTTCTCAALKLAFLAERLQAAPASRTRGSGWRRSASSSSDGIDAGSDGGTASALPSYFDPDVEDRVRRRIVLAAARASRPAFAPARR